MLCQCANLKVTRLRAKPFLEVSRVSDADTHLVKSISTHWALKFTAYTSTYLSKQ